MPLLICCREDEEYTVSEFITASIEGVTKALYLEPMGMILVLTIDGVLSLYNGFIQVYIHTQLHKQVLGY